MFYYFHSPLALKLRFPEMAQHVTDPFGSIQPELRGLIYILLAAHVAAFVSCRHPARARTRGILCTRTRAHPVPAPALRVQETRKWALQKRRCPPPAVLLGMHHAAWPQEAREGALENKGGIQPKTEH